MSKSALIKTVIITTALIILAVLLYQLPPVQQRLAWRVDFALAYLRGVINPVGEVPTPLRPPAVAVTNQVVPTATASLTSTAIVTDTPGPTPTSPPTATPIPAAISLSPPGYEKQDINNCGPATLAMYLRYYGWEGDQFDIANPLKPQREDRNVNVEELTYFARTNAGWLNTEYRVGGDLELLKQLLAAGIPVMIEESFYFEEPYWPNDDLWAAHYNLLTGYDEAAQTFTGQDSFYGPDQVITYQNLEEYWHSFNHVYILIYPLSMEETIKSILGEDWDVDVNRQNALDKAKAETESDPSDAYAWFNLGTNLVYFERYQVHSRRTEDLLALTEYALQITPNAEEALLWHGWALYRSGDTPGAIEDFRAALVENSNYADAQYALDFVRENP
jgi:tetratricopeptide (TPR) repeat protein